MSLQINEPELVIVKHIDQKKQFSRGVYLSIGIPDLLVCRIPRSCNTNMKKRRQKHKGELLSKADFQSVLDLI